MRRLLTVVVTTIAPLASCKKTPAGPTDDFTATPPTLLTTNSPTRDEDPAVLLLPTGRILAAWFSDRGANPDLYVASTTDRTTWTNPIRVTNLAFGDYAPQLFLDSRGTIHLVWFQWVSLYLGQLRHSTSVDGETWTPQDIVTRDFLVDDWLPTMTEAPDGTLLVYFVSDKRDPVNPTNEIYLATKRPGVTDWDPPIPVVSVNSPTLHDHLPAAMRIGGQIALVWVRHDTRNTSPWLTPTPKSDLFYATSADGRTFSTPVQITQESGDVANLFPSFYQKHDGSWMIEWLSTRKGPTQPQVFEIPVSQLTQYPGAVVEATWLPPGYTHRVTKTPTPNEYLALWVQGVEPTQDIYFRTITR